MPPCLQQLGSSPEAVKGLPGLAMKGDGVQFSMYGEGGFEGHRVVEGAGGQQEVFGHAGIIRELLAAGRQVPAGLLQHEHVDVEARIRGRHVERMIPLFIGVRQTKRVQTAEIRGLFRGAKRRVGVRVPRPITG